MPNLNYPIHSNYLFFSDDKAYVRFAQSTLWKSFPLLFNDNNRSNIGKLPESGLEARFNQSSNSWSLLYLTGNALVRTHFRGGTGSRSTSETLPLEKQIIEGCERALIKASPCGKFYAIALNFRVQRMNKLILMLSGGEKKSISFSGLFIILYFFQENGSPQS